MPPTARIPLTEAESRRELGVAREASADDIKRAYRRRMMRVHPDLNGGDGSRIAELDRAREAYRTLSEAGRGMGLHANGHRRATAAERATRVAQARRAEWLFLAWRQYGFLASLSGAVVGGLLWNGAAGGPRAPYFAVYLAAIAAAGALWGAGLAALNLLRK